MRHEPQSDPTPDAAHGAQIPQAHLLMGQSRLARAKRGRRRGQASALVVVGEAGLLDHRLSLLHPASTRTSDVSPCH